MTSELKRPALGVLMAIAITTAMDASGLSLFSALPLFPLMGIFWYLERLSRRNMGFGWGQWRHYGLAALYPILVLGMVTLVSAASGAVDLSQTDWQKAGLNFVLVTVSTILVVIITEEGFFRGWLWASLERASQKQSGALLLEQRRILAVALVGSSVRDWLRSAGSADSRLHGQRSGHGCGLGPLAVDFRLGDRRQREPWGLERNRLRLLRLWHRSRCARHRKHPLYGPEVGVLGLAVNVVFFVAFWRWWVGHQTAANGESPATHSLY